MKLIVLGLFTIWSMSSSVQALALYNIPIPSEDSNRMLQVTVVVLYSLAGLGKTEYCDSTTSDKVTSWQWSWGWISFCRNRATAEYSPVLIRAPLWSLTLLMIASGLLVASMVIDIMLFLRARNYGHLTQRGEDT